MQQLNSSVLIYFILPISSRRTSRGRKRSLWPVAKDSLKSADLAVSAPLRSLLSLASLARFSCSASLQQPTHSAYPPTAPMSAPTPIIAPAAPKNARSKRAQQEREPKLVEHGAKTAIFVRGNGISEKVKVALSELVRPYRAALLRLRADPHQKPHFLRLALRASPTEPAQEASFHFLLQIQRYPPL